MQKVHRVQRVVVGGSAASMDKTVQPPLQAKVTSGWLLVAGGWENHTTGLRPWENKPTALAGGGKPYNRAFGAWKYIPPLVADATTFPPQAGAQ